MKKAFTMIELVFVIVVIGILSAIMIPRMRTNPLQEAAIQLVSHIRYTQHLAMVDDKFDLTDPNWFKGRWMLRIAQNVTFGGTVNSNVWAYTIASDIPNYNGHNPDLIGMARNPLNTEQYLSGGYNNTLDVDDTKSMRKLRLGDSYGITNILFGGGCRTNTPFIHFDHLGRPMNSFTTNNMSYQVSPAGFPRLIINTCTIVLSNSEGNVTIAIEPETGYTCILNDAGTECI